MMEREWKQMEKTRENKSSRVETRGGRDGGAGGGWRPAAVEKLFTSHTQPEGEAERAPFIQKQPQLRPAAERESQSN